MIAEPNSAWGDVPYTLQPLNCKDEGDYIHFTPDYLTQPSPLVKPCELFYKYGYYVGSILDRLVNRQTGRRL